MVKQELRYWGVPIHAAVVWACVHIGGAVQEHLYHRFVTILTSSLERSVSSQRQKVNVSTAIQQ